MAQDLLRAPSLGSSSISEVVKARNVCVRLLPSMLRVADCVADCVWLAVPQTAEWQHIGNQIDRRAAVLRLSRRFDITKMTETWWLERAKRIDLVLRRRGG